jgi:hypothetical protein
MNNRIDFIRVKPLKKKKSSLSVFKHEKYTTPPHKWGKVVSKERNRIQRLLTPPLPPPGYKTVKNEG